MELNITETQYNQLDYIQQPYQQRFEEIPENTIPVKVIKKVTFDETTKPMIQKIPKINSKMVRHPVIPQKPKLSYEDILSKMGMFVSDGKLHLIEDNNFQTNINNSKSQPNQNNIKPQYDINPNIPQNSYIYNKYFKDQTPVTNNIRRPLSIIEYRNMLIQDALQKQKIKQIKSTKLVMPTSNINFATGSGNLNKLFNFSKR